MQSEKTSIVDFHAPENSLGFLLWQTTITWQKQIKKALYKHKISHTQFVIMAITMWLTEHQEETSQASIVKLSKLDKMTVSKALKSLIRKGLIARSDNEIDSRGKIVAFTTLGRQTIKNLAPLVEILDKQYFEVLYEQDKTRLYKNLIQLVNQ